MSNRSNEYRELVERSSLDGLTKHQLHVVNRMHAWYGREPLAMRDGTPIPNAVRRLARRIFAHACVRHRRPNLRRIGMLIDQRAIALSASKKARAFRMWARLSTLTPGAPIWIPLVSYPRFENRQGTRKLSLQVNDTERGLLFGAMTDVGETLAASRAAYTPRAEVLALDLGLRNLFATSEGDLLGRDWMDRLTRYGRKVDSLAAHRQRIGLRKVRSNRYRRYVMQLRGYIRSEVGRSLNRLVAQHAPAAIVVEHLRFQAPGLSRRLNRLLGWFGKAAVAAKLHALHETYGIEIDEVHAAYSSQECSRCHYVDKRNRRKQATFACLGCHHTANADVNGAKTLKGRRSVPVLSEPWRHRREVLEVLVRQHLERFARRQATPADPRLTNPYFRDQLAAVTS
ncbi:MAG TPA: transposase [Rhodanobacteraceae bacterium]